MNGSPSCRTLRRPARRGGLPVCAALAALLGVLAPPAAVRGQAVTELRRAARSAEAAYERTARWLAPTTFHPGDRDCVEVVGRFCLTFDTLRTPPTRPERREIAAARLKAITATARYFDVAPNELDAAAPLVRILVEDGRAEAAVEVARQFAAHADSAAWRDWLPGFALHAAGSDAEAAAHFERALAALPAAERAAIESIDWLLDPQERSRVRKLDPAQREQYVRRFWSIADPRLATPVNELWVQHVARHVEARIRSRIPHASGMSAWGRDLDQLTVRYGSPTARERVVGGPGTTDSWIEHFDTAGLALAPRALLRDGLRPPAPGERWAPKEYAPRSAHAIPALERIVPLPHQLTRFPRGDSMLLRLDAAIDSGGDALAAALIAVGRAGEAIAARHTALDAGARTLTLELTVPRDSLVYGAEVHDSTRRRLHHARYTLEPLPTGDLQLSDLLLTTPLPADSAAPEPPALTDLRLPPGTPLAVHAEVHGIAEHEPYEVDVGFSRADRPSALARGLGWIGARLGLARERAPTRVRWIEHAAASRIALDLPAPDRPGNYVLELRVRSRGHEAASRRRVRIERP